MSTLTQILLTTKTNMNRQIANTRSSRDVTRKGAARVVEIARAGTEIVLEEGFASLTKREVAKRLGIAHGNVGYYFPTRESLWRAVVDYEISEIHDQQMIDQANAIVRGDYMLPIISLNKMQP